MRIKRKDKVLMALWPPATQLMIIGHGRWPGKGTLKVPANSKIIFYAKYDDYATPDLSLMETILRYPQLARNGLTGKEKHRKKVDEIALKLKAIDYKSEQEQDIVKIKKLLLDLFDHCDTSERTKLTGVKPTDIYGKMGDKYYEYLEQKCYECYVKNPNKYIKVHEDSPLQSKKHYEQASANAKVLNYRIGHIGPKGFDSGIKDNFFKVAGTVIGGGDVDACIPWPPKKKRRLSEIIKATKEVKGEYYQVYHYLPCRIH